VSTKKKKPGDRSYALNKTARREYDIVETLSAGIELKGTEVKAVKSGGAVHFADSHIKENGCQLFLVNCFISKYNFGTHSNHEETRTRRLLVHKKEALRLSQKMREKGMSLIPLKMYADRHLIKVEIGLGKGKKMYEKREDMKKEDLKMQMSKNFKASQFKI
jgi:SsrA-binding protein